VGQQEAPKDSHEPGAYETLDRLLRRELNQLGTAEGNAANVSKDIVADDERGRQEEPDHALENVVHNEVCLDHDQVEGHVCPGKVGELEFEVTGFEIGDEEYETDNVEDEADKAVVRSKREKDPIDEDDMFEVVDYRLAVEKIHGGNEPIPVEALGRTQLSGAAGDACDGNDFLEGNDLDNGYAGDDVYMAREEGSKEEPDHDEGPKGADKKVGLFLLILGRLRLLVCLL
jgi:hypothetical protein